MMAVQVVLILAIVTLIHGEMTYAKKRILMSSSNETGEQLHSLQLEIQQMKSKFDHQQTIIEQMETKIQNQQAVINQLSGPFPRTEEGLGPIFTRWGKNTCPTNSSVIYTGYMAGTRYDVAGSSASLCLPEDPIRNLTNQTQSYYRGSHIYGSEYQFNLDSELTANNDVPCAVCSSTHGTQVLTIPGRDQCYEGWEKKYRGYLIGPSPDYQASVDFLCMDEDPDFVAGGASNEGGHLLYLAYFYCGALKCPPYQQEETAVCVVCSK